MLQRIALAAGALLAALLVFAATRPDAFRVQRSATIAAPPGRIYPLIDDFHQWQAWSPWEKKDPTMERAFRGAPSGPGAVYAWAGDSNIGAGSMTITEATPPSRLVLSLEFVRPFEAQNVVEFTLQPSGDVTTVTWTMDGTNTFVGKLMSLFLDMDQMVGGEFATGLATLKAITEKPAGT